jgi:acyl dehydratase
MRNAYLEDLSVGQRSGSGTIRVSAEDIIRFAQVYDPQPFHLDPSRQRKPCLADWRQADGTPPP